MTQIKERCEGNENFLLLVLFSVVACTSATTMTLVRSFEQIEEDNFLSTQILYLSSTVATAVVCLFICLSEELSARILALTDNFSNNNDLIAIQEVR
mmetsp:Transcript_20616/g.26701  ORF Transcript_20616/g.26701 Transcript_20616/m.26701 type:complete len:97 (+) Transcript_20616:154-444(+)